MARDPILEAFAEIVARRGPAPLVASTARRVTVEQVARAAGELERRLVAERVGAGEPLGLAAAPGPALLIGYLALRRLGAVPVLCDETRPTADRLTALERLGARRFLSEESGWPGAASEWSLDLRGSAPPARVDPAWGAIKLTSGSSGEPRGVAVRAEALLADDAQLSAAMGLAAADRFLAAIPLAHSYGFSSLALPALVRGSLLVVPADRSPLAPFAAAAELEVTVFPTVPAWIAAVVRSTSTPALAATVRRVIAAGAPLEPAIARAFRERTGRAVHAFYGASECGGIAYDRAGGAAERGTVGAPLPGVEVERDTATGRLRVRSPAVAERYLPESHPDLGGGVFTTGDLAELVDGEIALRGRADDGVLVRGRTVRPREVEEAIAAIPGVTEASVFGVDGPDGPRSQLRAVVAAPGAALDAAAVSRHLARRLAAHKIPRRIVVVGELPRTGRGKLDRGALAELVGR